MIGDDKLFAPLPRSVWSRENKRAMAKNGRETIRGLQIRAAKASKLAAAKRRAKREATNAAR